MTNMICSLKEGDKVLYGLTEENLFLDEIKSKDVKGKLFYYGEYNENSVSTCYHSSPDVLLNYYCKTYETVYVLRGEEKIKVKSFLDSYDEQEGVIAVNRQIGNVTVVVYQLFGHSYYLELEDETIKYCYRIL